MLTPTWQMDLFIFETIILIPVYIYMLIDIAISRRRHKTFQSPYYSLLISQGLADISTVLIFSSLISARYFSFGNVLIYSLSPYSALLYTNSGPFMFTLRAVGVFLISVQRYCTVCKPHGSFNYRLNNCPTVLLIIFHWLLAFVIYIPAFLNSNAYFENEITLFTVTSRLHQQMFSITVIGSFFIAGTSIVIMYSQIAIVMLRARKVSSSHTRTHSSKIRDARLTLHIFILVIFCFIAFFYYFGEFLLSYEDDVSRVKAFRLFYPTVSGNLSFINPIMLLTLNRDVQNRIKYMFRMQSSQPQSSVSVVPVPKYSQPSQPSQPTVS